MNRLTTFTLVAICLLSAAMCGGTQAPRARASERILGPCEGCEWVFIGMPETIPSTSRIAPKGEPGEPMRIVGTVVSADGKPAPGVIVYAYHTDDKGIYPRDESMHGSGVRHGKLRGWAKTDEKGQYRFDTIRPAGYPDTDIPQHVHMHVIEVGCCTYYIDDIHFEDDPRLTEEQRKYVNRKRGGNGLVMPRNENGTWVVTRDITLGMNVDDYPRGADR